MTLFPHIYSEVSLSVNTVKLDIGAVAVTILDPEVFCKTTCEKHCI